MTLLSLYFSFIESVLTKSIFSIDIFNMESINSIDICNIIYEYDCAYIDFFSKIIHLLKFVLSKLKNIQWA